MLSNPHWFYYSVLDKDAFAILAKKNIIKSATKGLEKRIKKTSYA